MVLRVGSAQFETLLEEAYTYDEDITTTIVMPEFSTEEASNLLYQFYGLMDKNSKPQNLESKGIEETNTTNMKSEVCKMFECEHFESDMDICNSHNLSEVSSRTSSSKTNQVTSTLISVYPYLNKDHSNRRNGKTIKKISKTLQMPENLSLNQNTCLGKPDESNYANLLRKEGNTWICLIGRKLCKFILIILL